MGIRFRKFAPTEYVMKVCGGETVLEGRGLTLLYSTAKSGIITVPVTAFDAGFLFDDVMSSDFQRLSVQGDLTFRITDYAKAAGMVDFTFRESFRAQEAARAEALQTLQRRILNPVKVLLKELTGTMTVREAVSGCKGLQSRLWSMLEEKDIYGALGVEIVSLTILAVTPSPETRKALEAASREEIMKQQDDAIYKRRNAAVEQERAIKENEMLTEVRMAEKEMEMREKEMETRRMLQAMEAEMEAQKISDEIGFEERRRELIELQAENEKKKSDAKAYDNEVLLKTFNVVDADVLKALAMTGMDPKTLIAKAFADMGASADRIGMLNVSPELLQALSAQGGA